MMGTDYLLHDPSFHFLIATGNFSLLAAARLRAVQRNHSCYCTVQKEALQNLVTLVVSIS
jgi:hypothetical protein